MDNRITSVGVSLSILVSVYGVGKRAFLRTAFNYVGVFYDGDNCLRTEMKNTVMKKMRMKKRFELQRSATDSRLKIEQRGSNFVKSA